MPPKLGSTLGTPSHSVNYRVIRLSGDANGRGYLCREPWSRSGDDEGIRQEASCSVQYSDFCIILFRAGMQHQTLASQSAIQAQAVPQALAVRQYLHCGGVP